MTYLIVFLVLALMIQGGLFYYSYRTKQKSKKDNILIKYKINTRSDLFSVICRNDIPQVDMDKLNALYIEQKDIY